SLRLRLPLLARLLACLAPGRAAFAAIAAIAVVAARPAAAIAVTTTIIVMALGTGHGRHHRRRRQNQTDQCLAHRKLLAPRRPDAARHGMACADSRMKGC